ncbi:MAG: hypothetical protein EOM23_09615 [Candidatus Moranbacteria bacterium]|nr:hypothetical protein [Candidatus Moranbacteria bacterium]
MMPSSCFYRRDLPVKDILFGKNEREIRDKAPERKIINYLNAKYGKHANVGFYSRPFIAGLDSESISNCWYNWKFNHGMLLAKSANEVLHVVEKYQLSHLILFGDEVTPNVFTFLTQYSEIEFEFGAAKLYKIRNDRELLDNCSFESGLEGWEAFKDVQYLSKHKSIIVSNDNHVFQEVEIYQANSYKLEIKARCVEQEGAIRLQVGWVNKSGEFISATIFPKQCMNTYNIFSAEMVPPNGATKAIVFIHAHGNDPVEVDSVSFKRG